MSKTSFIVNQDGLAIFTFLRPERRNAIDYDVMEDLRTALIQVKASSRIKMLMITGEGEKAFCSGGDLEVFHKLKTEKEAYEMLNKMGMILYDLLTLPKPTVALLNGAAVGGGCEVAIACDLRLASEYSKMGFVQGNLGITTGWGGASILMEKLLPQDALFMLYTGKLFTAEEARQIGYVQKVFSSHHLQEQAINHCGEILKKPYSVLTAYKEAMIRKWTSQNLFAQIQEEIKQCAKLWETDEHHKRVDSFMNRKS
ncbi:enoyl-CoA hydratase/isomerase family protein [Bacillus songklensis]|uniref:Ethylmalonyl-CoA decarboxylase n=1 Tax=Bacillus songklensis TaxID=1069116 RepID=A0ABV8AXI8_9BACI